MRIVSAALALWATVAPIPALADPATEAFHADVAAAYRHYREAVHYLENDNPELAALSLGAFQSEWDALARKYADNPPPAYARDGAFKATFVAIRAKADELAGAIESRPREAWSALGLSVNGIPALLAEQRKRNGQRAYSDCIDAMNATMRDLWAYRRMPPKADREDQVATFKAAVRATMRDYRRCRDEAPAGLRDNEDFRRLFEGALASLAKLEAVDLAHSDALVSILRELHSFDRLIWLKFG